MTGIGRTIRIRRPRRAAVTTPGEVEAPRKVEVPAEVTSVPIRPSRRHELVRKAIQDVPPLTIPEEVPVREKEMPAQW